VPLAVMVQLIPAGVDVIVPWPFPPGTIAIVPVAPGGGGGACCVQPLRNAGVGVPEPSSTSTMQSAGAGYGSLSILKLPFPSLVPSATPSTVIGRLGSAVPSIRSRVPLSSAREMLTAAAANEAAIAATTITIPATPIRRLTTLHTHYRCDRFDLALPGRGHVLLWSAFSQVSLFSLSEPRRKDVYPISFAGRSAALSVADDGDVATTSVRTSASWPEDQSPAPAGLSSFRPSPDSDSRTAL
jgi:hypothetical protein